MRAMSAPLWCPIPAGVVLAAICVLVPVMAAADPCRLQTPDETRLALEQVRSGVMLVRYCWYCDDAEPIPLRVREAGVKHVEPEQVGVTAWAGEPREETFPLASLEQAEADRTGALADFIRADIERTTDTTGYLGPDDPYLLREKRAGLEMTLRDVRSDHAGRTWDELRINGEPADPRLLYVPLGGSLYGSLGHRVGCAMGSEAQRTVEFRPARRSPEREAPPNPFIADVTEQCYDGSCPLDEWRVHKRVALRASADPDAQVVGHLEVGEQVTPLRQEMHVHSVPAEAEGLWTPTRDFGHPPEIRL